MGPARTSLAKSQVAVLGVWKCVGDPGASTGTVGTYLPGASQRWSQMAAPMHARPPPPMINHHTAEPVLPSCAILRPVLVRGTMLSMSVAIGVETP